jgi:phospholipid/cholesterol/gamma-HCH transport system substrate-binding protein
MKPAPARGMHARNRVPNWVIGILAIAGAIAAILFAFVGEVPWSKGHEVRAVFPRVQGLNPDSPVRIAGVDVGKVTAVDHAEATAGSADGEGAADEDDVPVGASIVTIELSDEALPIHRDATMRVRPRLFLEGNYFIELETGSPSAPALEEGETIPYANTSAPVQLDEVLTSLQSNVRKDLQVALDELGGALVREGGTKGLREIARSAGGAAKQTAIVNEALLGTERDDLSALIRNLGRVTAALDRNEPALQGLVSSSNAVAGALAAEGEALERSVAELPGTLDSAMPTLDALNGSLPATRAFAREALPGTRALPPALDAATPLLTQLRGLVSKDELRGALADLRPTIPRLASLTGDTTTLLGEARALSSCFSEIVIPWAQSTPLDPETPANGPIYKETSWGLTGISGESRNFDGNGPWARVLGASGANFATLPPLDGSSDQVIGMSPLPLLGARPALGSSAHTPFRRDIACERNEPPDLDSGQAAPPPEQSTTSGLAGDVELTGLQQDAIDAAAADLERAGALADDEDATAAERRRAGAMGERAVGEIERTLAEAHGWQDLLQLGGGG